MDAEVGEQAISVEFRDLALAEAVRRMLRATNFLLVYAPRDEGTRLTQIWIASRDNSTRPLGDDRWPALPAPLPPTAEEPAAAMKEPAAAVELPLDALIQAATDEANLAARIDAIGVLGSHASHDARVGDLLEHLANHDPHPQVRDAAAVLLGGGR
jgi:hypothetical protein